MDNTVLERIRQNDHRVLSRVISQIENDADLSEDFFIALHSAVPKAIHIGITGPPGAGKSTLVDKLIPLYLDKGHDVGVVAVDPTSPFTGGALLGDRIRMNRFPWDDRVFIRSMGSHGDLGGLARKVQEVGDVLVASGKDVIIYETVGVGQGENEVAKTVDLTVVVLVPESGDEVQLMKAGLIEIGDLFVINKSDRSGAQRLAQILRNTLQSFQKPETLLPPVVNTVASQGEGVDTLFATISDHLRRMDEAGILTRKRVQRHRDRILALIQEKLLKEFWTSHRLAQLEQAVRNLDSTQTSPYSVVRRLLETTDHA
jgi:LAO/AO transport system kinase